MKQGWTYKKLNEVCDKGSSNIVINKLEDNNGDYPLFGASGLVKNVDFYHQDKPYIGIVKDGAGVGRVNTYPAFSSLVGTMQYIFAKENCLLDFIKYFLIKLDLSHCVSGATIPHIYFKDYGKERIPVPSIEVQKSIVAELDKINELISLKKAQLSDLDRLTQSIFYNMFGNPVENEKGWIVKSIEEICSSIVRGPFGSALKKDFFVKPDSTTYKIYEQKHAIQKDATIGSYYVTEDKFKELSRFEVKPNDIIMSCSGTIGELYRIPSTAEKGLMNQALLKFTLSEDIHYQYFLYLMEYIKKDFTVRGTGLQNIGSVKIIKKMSFGLPPLSLQQEFANRIEAIEKQKNHLNTTLKDLETLLASRMQHWFE